MPELMEKCATVCERLAGNQDQSIVVHHFGRLLDLIEAEHADLMALKPVPFVSPDWERAFSWHARRDVRDADNALDLAKGMYRSQSHSQWLDELEEMTRKAFTLRQLWQRWTAVEQARDMLAALPADATARQRIDAEVSLRYIEALYDLISRRFYGREDRPRQYLAENRLRLRPPHRKPSNRK
jgi:hypothetical protein